jgi:signal transduction histidine kinase
MNAGVVLRSFKAKIVISILAIGILAVLTGLSVIYWIGREHIQRSIGSQFRELAHETSEKMLSLLEHNVEEAVLLGMSTDIKTPLERANRAYSSPPMSEEEIHQRIETLKRLWDRGNGTDSFSRSILDGPASQYIRGFLNNPAERDEHISIIVTDARGILVGADAKPPSVYYGDDAWWQAAFDQGRGKVYVSDVELIQPETDEVAFDRLYGLGIVVPVMNQAGTRAIGIIRMNILAKRFFEAVTMVKVGKTDHTMLASSDGSLIFCPVFLIRNHTLRPEFLQAVLQDQPGWTQTLNDVHYGGRLSINGFSPVRLGPDVHPASLSGKQWFIFTSQDPIETYFPLSALQKWIAVCGAIGAVILSFLGIWAAGFIVKPLKNLQMGARLIGYGNLDHRLNIQTGDEIEELSREFNEMAIKLKASYSALEQKVAERTKELSVVNKITRIISSSLDLRLIFEAFTEEITKLLHFDRISVALLDESGDYIQIRMIGSKGGPLIIRDSPPRPKKGTAVGLVVDKAQPFIRLDAAETRQFVEDRLVIRDGFRSYIFVPIISKRKPIGTLNLISRHPEAYSERNFEILQPIAEQLAIAIETIRLFEQTKKLDQLKSDFVSKVSHELRTPLTSIKGFTEILMSYSDVDGKTQHEFLGIINDESERLTRLINDILDLSKIEAGRVEWQIQPVPVADLVEHTTKLFGSQAAAKNLQLLIKIPKNLPLVRGDRDQLHQVMDNLLSNAIKFTPSGRIAIQARQEDAFVKVSVSDTGIGIAREDQSKIFEKFHQLGDIRSGHPRGTGLGLAICREIITRLGGRIWCESELDKGSTFYFTLPVWSKDLRYGEPAYKNTVRQST